MNSLKIALALIRIPRLFVSLLFWPMVVGLGVATMQALASSAYFGLVGETTKDFAERMVTEGPEIRWVRENLYGQRRELPPLNVCVWQDGQQPPGPECEIKPYDVTIQNDNPRDFNNAPFVQFFEGATRTLHVCPKCTADIVITTSDAQTLSHVRGIKALGVYALTDALNARRVNRHYIDAKAAVEELKNISGTVFLHPEGSSGAINMTQATKVMMLIINAALIVLIALWLSLKGHRKVLDYFAANGALLPLVAACGKGSFYSALWMITSLRVILFLVAVLPSTIILYTRAIPDETLNEFVKSGPDFVLWLSGLLTSLACLAIVASIADLKHRHGWLNIIYRYVPILLAVCGTVIWIGCIIDSSQYASVIQNIIASIPIVGVAPILISPLLTVQPSIIAVHSTLAGVFAIFVLRANARWFAAHLEEL